MPSSTTSTASDLEGMFVTSLPVVDRIIAIQARRHGLSAADAEEFGAWAKARLIDGSYAIYRKFDGRSALATYLSAVFVNLFRDYRNSRWGRWRASAEAKRLGPIAVRLEELLHRDGCSFREASQTLRASGVTLRDGELARLAVRLPPRRPPDDVSLEALGEGAPAAGGGAAAAAAAAAERLGVPPPPYDDGTARAVADTLRAVVGELEPEDGLILRMHFWDDQSVAAISRALRLDQKALYRRLDRIKARLKAALEARGIDRAVAAEILSGEITW